MKVLIIGLGSLGSIVVKKISKMNVRSLLLVDFDYVETHNLNSGAIY